VAQLAARGAGGPVDRNGDFLPAGAPAQLERLVAEADARVYVAKGEGRDRVVAAVPA
jgi:GGDEF domain-containing protein